MSENQPQAPQTPDTAPENTPDTDPRLQRANAEAAKYRVERNQARDELLAREAEYKAQREALEQQLAEAFTAREEARLHALRLNAAAAHGLPAELAERLQGIDAESLHADAQRLAALMPLRKNPRTGKASTPAPSRAEQIFQRIGGGGHNAFDVLLQQRVGGGALNADDEQ